jgi:23S rRNA (cytidine2498-2'-O)-methyltransferase
MPAPVETTTAALGGTVYLAAEGYEAELRAELGRAAAPLVPGGRLFVLAGDARPAAWAANVWLDPVRIHFESPADAVRELERLGRNWALFPVAHFRRAALLAQRVPFVSNKPFRFPSPPPLPLGCWTMTEPHVVVAAARSASPFPNGEARFVEDHERPPSRAYLKLWEALTIAGHRPGPGSRCVDLGASPGGWTWALERLGARVLSVDKAPLDARLAKLTRIKFLKDSAFAVSPAAVGKVDWVVSDVVCYPERLVGLVERWLAAHPSASYVVTIKFQGKTDMAPLAPLAAVPGSRLVHLFHNKHELTWIRVGSPSGQGLSSKRS